MRVLNNVLAAVGSTPMIRLCAASQLTGCDIYGKCEFMNPGGSVKDRAARYMLEDALASGLIEAGGTVVEGTAGNTGIGLTLVGNALGLRTVIVMPDTQSEEKKSALRSMGAELRTFPAVPYRNPENYVHQARRLAESMVSEHGVFYANQWDNLSNRTAHMRSTAPEIWDQTGGEIDAFICAVGTGGTLAGVSLWLKDKHPEIVIAAADPDGAGVYSWIKHGEMRSSGSSITEGVGQNRVTGNLEGAVIDDAFNISDSELVPVLWNLMGGEGLYVGPSSALNVAGAIRLGQALGPGKTIVTILCDSAARYATKLFNRDFLCERQLPLPPWLS
ncbi:MAG: cysteine synthase A [Wenzhouxiangella sp.]|jgi:cysteine synthase A|nr:cysteine synthase A [Wenzhouxiangella sp.]